MLENGVDFVLKEVTDEEIGDQTFGVRILLDESSEAEAFVVFADEPAHAVHADKEIGAPLAELGLGGVA